MTNHSRRDAIKLLGAGAAAAGLPGLAAGASARPPQPSSLAYFALSEVRLGEGPFLHAQKMDEKYLLALEPDRMLANFRTNAGLEPRAPVYGGWESVEPWIDIRCHGHTAGHYLTAAACMYESTLDRRFADRVDYMVSELAECQAKTGGWLAAFPDGVAPLTDSLAGREFAGVPWYTTHKVLAGLRDAHLHRGSKSALEVLVKFADWIDSVCADVSDDRFQKMLDREHGGMNEVLADLFAITGDARYGRLAQRFSHRALLDPLAAGEDKLNGLHANTQIPKVVGFSRITETVGKPGDPYDSAAKFFWKTVTGERSFATGGHGDGEHFFPTNEFPKHLGSGKTMETCCTHNMLRLTRSLYGRDPRAAYFDYFEKALFNGILASQDPETGMNTYFQSTRPGYVRLYHQPFDAFWCCTGSGIENHARYGESIYAHGGDTLYVNLFMASTLEWKDRGVSVTQRTRFPDADTTRLEFKVGAKPPALAIRQPSWCAAMTVGVGRRKHVARKPGSYFRLPSTLRDGDVVTVRLPMALHAEPLPNAPDHVALMYGPIVLGGRMGTEGLSPGSQLIINERESGKMLQADVKIPRWTRPLADLVKHTTRTSADRLEFRISGFDGGAQVDLIPWFRLTHERYNLYWRNS
ncbi:MAG: hypothetical protein K0Q92_2886 [Steroidobacteraceae bacterium]|nr:hypothetical protein [Steroidobacteraceae bacterium]